MFLANKLNKGAGTPVALDAQFNYVTMLLHGDGTNGAQNNTFLDSSSNNFSLTRNGNITQGSFSPYGSNWSNYFDGTSDNLTYTGGSSLNFGTGDFTIELWAYLTNTGTFCPFLRPDDSGAFPEFGYNFSTGQLQFDARNAAIVSVTTTMPTDQWAHIAACRSGTSLRLFINGTQVGSTTTNSTNFGSTTGTIRIAGSSFSTTHNVNGYVSNFRVLKGTALYTTTFTPSTAPLTAITNTSLLTCQSNRFIDNSTNNYTITTTGTPSVQRFNPFGTSTAYSTSVIGGSAYCDGTSDSLSISSNSVLNQSGDFTTEVWVYLNATPTANLSVYGFEITNFLKLAINSSRNLIVDQANVGPRVTSTDTIPLNSWAHVALVRNGSGTNNCKIYINGTYQGQFTDTTTVTVSGTGYILAKVDQPSITLNGYATDFRFSSSAVYTAAFTPPTAPLTTVSGTQILCKFQNGAIFDNAMINDLETVGNAQISTSVVKYGTGSLYMNASAGDTDYFVQPATNSVYFGTGNFTIEFWMNPLFTNTSWGGGNLATIMDTDAPVGTGTNWWVVHQQNDTIMFASNSAVILLSSAVLSANVWQHVAIVRNGSTITIYVNGTSAGSTTYATTLGGNRRLTIGTQLGGSRWYKGYLDDIRITTGYARYTANFTPPTAAFPNIGPV